MAVQIKHGENLYEQAIRIGAQLLAALDAESQPEFGGTAERCQSWAAAFESLMGGAVALTALHPELMAPRELIPFTPDPPT